MQLAVNRRWSQGLQLNVNYTLSKAMTDASSDRSDFVQDINNKGAERALASYDRTHIFGANYVWALPFANNPADKMRYNLIGGWEISGNTQLASGTPLTIAMTANTSNSYGNVSRRPDLVGDPNGPGTIAQWFNTAAFALPAPNTFGNAPRSVVRGPWRHWTDLALFKNFVVNDQVRMQFRLEAFNVLNETNFTTVQTNISSPALFGRITAAGDPRMIQMGLKVIF